MATVREALVRIEEHEKTCSIRYQNIEKRLDEGSQRFKKSEMMLWGMYPLIIGLFLIEKNIL